MEAVHSVGHQWNNVKKIVQILVITLCIGLAGCTKQKDLVEGTWVEVNTDDPVILNFHNGKVNISIYDSNYEGKYKIKDNEITVDSSYYLDLRYTTQETNGKEIEVLSSIMFEDDGIGLFIEDEYIREENMDLIDEHFQSEYALKINGKS